MPCPFQNGIFRWSVRQDSHTLYREILVGFILFDFWNPCLSIFLVAAERIQVRGDDIVPYGYVVESSDFPKTNAYSVVTIPLIRAMLDISLYIRGGDVLKGFLPEIFVVFI